MIFEGCKPEQGFLQTPHVPEAVSELKASAFRSIRPQFAYHSGGNSDAFNLMEFVGNFDDVYSVLTATGASDDDEQDLNHLGLADFTSSLHLRPAKDVSTSVPDFLWMTKQQPFLLSTGILMTIITFNQNLDDSWIWNCSRV